MVIINTTVLLLSIIMLLLIDVYAYEQRIYYRFIGIASLEASDFCFKEMPMIHASITVMLDWAKCHAIQLPRIRHFEEIIMIDGKNIVKPQITPRKLMYDNIIVSHAAW